MRDIDANYHYGRSYTYQNENLSKHIPSFRKTSTRSRVTNRNALHAQASGQDNQCYDRFQRAHDPYN
ncbi:hypothetical protein D3C84_964940 [compost metagenome]